MEYNKWVLYCKTLATVALLALLTYGSMEGWKKFKHWAIEKKTKKLATIAMGNRCNAAAACNQWLTETIDSCSAKITTFREDKGAAELGAKDQRQLLACLQKSEMKHNCAPPTDKCVSRIDNRYDSCFEFAYPMNIAADPEAGANLVGCLYGVKFESRSTSALGVGTEEVVFKRKKVVRMDDTDKQKLTDEVVQELTAEIRKLGEDRKENFDEAMSALRESRGDSINPEEGGASPIIEGGYEDRPK